MSRILRLSLFSAFLVLALSGCSKDEPLPSPYTSPEQEESEGEGEGDGESQGEGEGGNPAAKIYYLPVIETTDIHGYIVNNQSGTVHYRLAYIADKVMDIRGQSGEYAKDRLLLLDGGDLYQGAFVSNYMDGWPIFAAMDRMDYDAVALGNHEFDWDIEDTVDQDATMPDYQMSGQNFVNDVPVLCANLYKDGSRVSCTKDYVIVEKTAVDAAGDAIKVKLGIIGFAVDYSGSIMPAKFTDQGYYIKENYSAANDIAAELESSGQCDATVLLIHGAADEAAENLGSRSPIDLVLGGHSHSTMSGRSSAGIAYLQGGRYAEHYAYADMSFSMDAEENVSFSSIDNLKIMSVDSGRDLHSSAGQNADDLDEDVLEVSDYALSVTSDAGNEVVGYISVNAYSYSIEGSGGRVSPMSNWMCDILCRIGGADVAFVNSGGVRTYFTLGGQSRRDITVSNVYEMFPFNNNVYVYDITYAELLEVFEYSLTSGGKSLFSGMTGIDCHFKNYSVVSLVKDGTVIYQDEEWTGDWASRSVVLAASEYLATNQRVDYYTGMGNPLVEWNNSPKLVQNDLVDNENAVRVLKEEAASSGGHLYIDTKTHFIEDE